MRALSLTQPWAWLVLHAGKRIENRTRNLGNYRGPLLLHASKGMSEADWWSAYDFVAKHFGHVGFADQIPQPRALFRGGIVGVCEVVGQLAPHPGAPPDLEDLPHGQGRWYMGAHAYVLDQVRELTVPIPCKGALGLWTPPADVVRQVFIHGGQR